MEQEKPQYDATNIQVLGGIEAVRKRPAMYIGDTAISGLHHLVYEVMDNSIDESMAGYCTEISISVNADNSVTVSDNGRGIPVDMHKTENKPALEVVMTVLHAGGKFDRKVYQVSGGLHGVGVSVVNALSEWLEVEIKKGGQVYHQRYERGKTATPLKVIGDTKTTGTKITFKPDEEIFESVEFDDNILSGRLKELAFLNAGLKISFSDERKGFKEEYKFEGGLISFVNSLNKNKKVLFEQPCYFKKSEEDVEVEIAFQYNEGYSETVLSFANNVNTKEGGTHISGFRGGLTRAINEYAKSNGFLSDKPLAGEDVREGLVSVVSVKLGEPQFEGQTKTKLGNSRVRFLVEGLTTAQIITFLEENPGPAREIINKCLMTSRAREAARKARELTRKKLSETGALPGKLADCSIKDPAQREIFIVEGDSAGGSAKQGRDRKFQAILPLKGKIINSEKAPLDKVLNNNEVKMMISAVGGGVGEDFNAEKIRYAKIIIMTDADVDGAHIRTLLLTFFYRQMTDLIKRGNIYIAQPPLYKVKRGKKEFYVDTESQMDETLINLAKDNLTLQVKKEDSLADVTSDINILANLTKRLNELNISLEIKGIKLDDLLNSWKTNKTLPLYRIQHKDQYTFCEDDNALSEFLQQNNAEHIDLFGENEDYNLMDIYESRDIAKILNKIEAYGISVESSSDDIFFITEGEKKPQPTNLTSLYDNLKSIGKKGLSIQRYKGLGEMNPSQLWETTMDPATRRMKQVTLDDAVKAEDIFTILMGDAVEPRREFIQAFAREVKNLDI